MPAIIFIHPDGKSDRVETSDGEGAMQAATRHNLDGILAELRRQRDVRDLPRPCRPELAGAPA